MDGIAGFEFEDKVYLYRKNVQGDITHIYRKDTDKLVEVAHYAYDAFGNTQILSETDKIGSLNPFRYRGYYFDCETKLYYLISRYYDPETCRFISADSIEYLDPETIGGLNLYAYCGNNPVMNVDPTGHKWWHWLVAALVVVALVAATMVSAGSAAGGIAAITFAAHGIAFGSTATTVFAFATVASAVGLAGYAGYSLITSTENGITTGSLGSAVNTFMDMGEDALTITVTSGITGGIGGYISYKQQIGNPSQNGFMSKYDQTKQRKEIWISESKNPNSRFYGNPYASQGRTPKGYQINHIYGKFGNNRNYYQIVTIAEHRQFHSIYGYKTAGGSFNRINPNYINWWQILRGLIGG